MNISRSEAEAALSDIEQAALRTRTQCGYRIAAPILILWGVIWVLAYTGTGLAPAGWWSRIWLPLDAVGIVGSLLVVHRSRGDASARRTRVQNGFSPLHLLAILFMLVATFMIFGPTQPAVYLVYPGLLCGFSYMMFGISRMPRLAWIGAAMSVLTLLGFFLARDILAFWMAGIGGGGLILGGLWLRKL
jgi:hypothetical protein